MLARVACPTNSNFEQAVLDIQKTVSKSNNIIDCWLIFMCFHASLEEGTIAFAITDTDEIVLCQ